MWTESYSEKVWKRFWAKVAKDGEGCRNWTASLTGGGYGQFWDGAKRVDAHRFAYRAFRGPIPEELQLDHLCRNRRCANPWHLEAVTIAENLRRGEGPAAKNARKTHCDAGHEFVGANLYVDPRGKRHCRECRRKRSRECWKRAYADGRTVGGHIVSRATWESGVAQVGYKDHA